MKKRGFTLVELLIVVAIIGLLATIVGVAINGARAKARDNKRVSDLRQIQKGLELGFAQGSGYPVASGLVIGGASSDVLCGKGATIAFVGDDDASNCDSDKIYLGHIPSYPIPPAGEDYMYTSTDGESYCVEAELERELPSLVLSAGPVRADHLALRNGTCP